MNDRRIKTILLIIVVLALLLRIFLFFVTYGKQGSGGITQESLGVAESLVEGHGFSTKTLIGFEPSNFELPGYPLYLSLTILLLGTTKGLWIASIVQMILSSVGVLLCFAIGKRLFNTSIGLFSAGLWAIYYPEALLSTYVLHDSLMPVGILTSTYFFIRAVTEKKQVYYYLSALFIGLASIIRSDFLLLPGFFFLSCLCWNIYEWKNHLKTAAVMFVIIFIILLPWGLRNYAQFNKFSITRSVLWGAIWEGFGEFPNSFGAVLDDTITNQQIVKEYGNIDVDSDEYNQILKQKVITAVKSDPLWLLKMLPKRLINMVIIGGGAHGHEIFSLDPNYHYASSYKLKNKNGNVFSYLLFLTKKPRELFVRVAPLAFRGIILLLALTGLLLWRKEWKKILLFLSVYLYGIFSHLPIYWEPRMLVPIEFPLLFLAGLAIFSLLKKLKSTKLT